jgi:hypothetical protein
VHSYQACIDLEKFESGRGRRGDQRSGFYLFAKLADDDVKQLMEKLHFARSADPILDLKPL